MGIETIIGVGGSLLGSALQSGAASDAADAQSAASAASIAENRRQYDQTRSDYAPYRSIGTNALRRLGALYGLQDTSGQAGGSGGVTENEIRQMLIGQYSTPGTPGRWEQSGGGEGDGVMRYIDAIPGTVNQPALDTAVAQRMQNQPATGAPQVYNDGLDAPIEMDPGYEFGLRQGQQALDRKFAASGGRVSGASLKAAQQYGVDYATAGYNSAYQRRQDRINRLQQLAGIGQTSTAASAQAGDAAAARNANLYGAQGNAAGAASLAQGSIWGNAINQAGAQWQRRPQQDSGGWMPNYSTIPMQPGGGY